MRECLDEGILQSYFDGELSSDHLESVTSHLVSCMDCAAAARELESEINLLSSALEPEFAATVPTEQLRHRIDVAVAGLELGNQPAFERSEAMASRGWLHSLTALFAFTPQPAFGYAALAVVVAFAGIIGVIQFRNSQTTGSDKVAEVTTGSSKPSATATPDLATGSEVIEVTPPPSVNPPAEVTAPVKRPRSVRPRTTVDNQAVAEVKLLPGERSYLQTIAALNSTIKAGSNKPMRPALQSEYERNLAVVDRALAATRNAAKKNPNDPDAAEFMFNAYQSKVDLLNTVADARLYNRP